MRLWGNRCLLAAIAVASTLRQVRLGVPDLWLDEAASWQFARADLADSIELLRLDSGPPLYYWLLRVWMTLAGESAFALRALSALLAAATVPVLWALGRRLLPPGVAPLAAWIFALLPLAVYAGRQARAYPLLTLTAAASVLSLLRWLDTGRRRDLVAVAVATAATLLSHNYGFFLLLPLLAILLVDPGPRRRVWAALAALGGGLFLYLPWLGVLRAQLANRPATAWIAPIWHEHGFSGSLLASLRALAPGGATPRYLDLPHLPALEIASLVLLIPLLVLGIVALLRRASKPSIERRNAVLILAWAFLPPLAAATWSLLFLPVYLPVRLDQLTIPAACLLLAAGLGALPRRLRWGTLGAFLAFSLLAVGLYLRALAPGGDRALAAAVRAELRPGDAIVTTGLTRAPLAYHLRDIDGLLWRSFPADVANHQGTYDPAAYLTDPAALHREAAGLLDTLAAAPIWSSRLFLVIQPDEVSNILLQSLLADPRPRRDRALGDYQQTRLGVPARLFLLDYR